MPGHLFHVEKFIETKFVYLDIHLARLFLVLCYTVYFDIPLLSDSASLAWKLSPVKRLKHISC